MYHPWSQFCQHLKQGWNEVALVLVCLFLVFLAAIASGLTVGLLSMEPLDLRMLRLQGNFEEKYKANEVLKLIADKHLIMVTLLLTNSIAMEALPVFLDKLVPSWVAVTLSVTAILIFGEILPQAFCTGPQQLDIAYRSAPLMNALICITYPISKPVSVILDHWFGPETERNLDRSSLKTLVALHRKSPDLARPLLSADNYHAKQEEFQPEYTKSMILGEDGHVHDPWAADVASDASHCSTRSDGLLDDEIVVIQGALDLASKRVCDIMTPMKRIFAMEANQRMTQEARHKIVQNGFSRIPVYDTTPDNIIGIILVKSLLDIQWTSDDAAPTCASCMVANRQPIFVGENVSLWSMLNEFQKGRTHIAFVVENPKAYKDNVSISDEIDDWGSDSDSALGKEQASKRLLGCLTIEDIFEELIQEEIYDEYDFKKKPITYTEKNNGLASPTSKPKQPPPPPPSNSPQNNLNSRGPSMSTGFTGSARSRIMPRINSITAMSHPASTHSLPTKTTNLSDMESGLFPASVPKDANPLSYVTVNDLYYAQNVLQTVLGSIVPNNGKPSTQSAPMTMDGELEVHSNDESPIPIHPKSLGRTVSTKHASVLSRNQRQILSLKQSIGRRSDQGTAGDASAAGDKKRITSRPAIPHLQRHKQDAANDKSPTPAPTSCDSTLKPEGKDNEYSV